MKGMICLAVFSPDYLAEEEDFILNHCALHMAVHLRKDDYGVNRNTFSKYKKIFEHAFSDFHGYDKVWVLGKGELDKNEIIFATKAGHKESWLINDFLNDGQEELLIEDIKRKAKKSWESIQEKIRARHGK